MNRGCFVSFEGGEGCGKSTQANLLAEWLSAEGVPTVLTREPGGTAGAEAIRRLLLSPPAGEWGLGAEALLFAAARSDHLTQLIEPALASGKWVICDRFVDSSLAYQGVAGGFGLEAVRALHQIGSDGILPDRTILLRLDEHAALDRAERRDAGAVDAIGGRDAAYHRKVADAFSTMAALEPIRWAVVDAGGTPSEVHDRVRAVIEPLLSRQTR